MRTKELVAFMKAREYARRVHDGEFTSPRRAVVDPIIARYRFCNMDRNDDRVTKFIFKWAEQYHGHEDLWFAFVVARLFNNPDTLDFIASTVLPFRLAAMRKGLVERRTYGHKVFNAAYIVSTNGIAMDKVDYLLERVLAPLWKKRAIMRPKAGETLANWHARLQESQGMGSFMAAQVVADLKYAPGPLASASDFATFAASGPGSRRGLNRVMRRHLTTPWKEGLWRAQLAALREAVLPLVKGTHLEGITAQNLQNCLCEFDKYERARLGEGEPKQLYAPWKERKDEL
jgi:hypothetical protein